MEPEAVALFVHASVGDSTFVVRMLRGEIAIISGEPKLSRLILVMWIALDPITDFRKILYKGWFQNHGATSLVERYRLEAPFASVHQLDDAVADFLSDGDQLDVGASYISDA